MFQVNRRSIQYGRRLQAEGQEVGFSAGVSSWIVHVLVTLDSKKVAGYTIASISDYIAMLVLARGGEEPPSPTGVG